MDLMPMGKFAMDHWAAEANLETEPDGSQQEDPERRRGRLSRWTDSALCLASHAFSKVAARLERSGLPDLTFAGRVRRSGC